MSPSRPGKRRTKSCARAAFIAAVRDERAIDRGGVRARARSVRVARVMANPALPSDFFDAGGAAHAGRRRAEASSAAEVDGAVRGARAVRAPTTIKKTLVSSSSAASVADDKAKEDAAKALEEAEREAREAEAEDVEALAKARGEIAEQVECFDRVDRLREAAAVSREAKRAKLASASATTTKKTKAAANVVAYSESESESDDDDDNDDVLVDWRAKKL